MTKQEARQQMTQMRKELSAKERERQNRAIEEVLFAEPIFSQIEWFYPFVSYGTEVDTTKIIQRAFSLKNKAGNRLRIAVPRVQGREMAFYEIHSMEDLVSGYRGILEPSLDCQEVEARYGLMLMPGLAFDCQKNRVGYGGGYYDRYLKRYGGTELFTWAVAYDFQVIDSIQTEKYDIRPQRIITAEQILN